MSGPAAVASALATDPGTRDAITAACEKVIGRLGEGPVDLCLLVVSPHHAESADWALPIVQERLAPAALIGCSASGAIGAGREVERGPAVMLWAARLPAARGAIEPFHLDLERIEGGFAIRGLPAALATGEVEDRPPALLIADPHTFPVEEALALANQELPGLHVVGGLASGAADAGEQVLFCDGEIHRRGAVGVLFGAGVAMVTAVSQGCQPVGPDMVVTAGEGPVVAELAGTPALVKLREVLEGLSERDRELVRHGLMAGVVIDENRPDYGRGDYLMRGISMLDERAEAPPEALIIGADLRVGQTVRLQARDATSADADLRAALGEVVSGQQRAVGGLLFSCTGRGRSMFGSAHHDVRLAQEVLGTDAIGGFFAAGEIGPVGGRNFVHGFTATMAVFLDDPA